MVKILQIAKIPAFMKGYNPVIKFGVSKIGDNEHPPVNSFSDFASTGRAIGFEVVNSATGEISLDATYDLVCYLKDNCEYRKLVLSYDTMGPSGNETGESAALHALILVSIPEIPGIPLIASQSFKLSSERQLFGFVGCCLTTNPAIDLASPSVSKSLVPTLPI